VREQKSFAFKKQRPLFFPMLDALRFRGIMRWVDNNEGENGGGSLLTMWKKFVLGYESHIMGKGFIALFGKLLSSALRCVIVNVYAACAYTDKERLWEELSNIKAASQDLIWCFCGDFNAIRTRSERKSINSRVGCSRETYGFNNFIETNLLLDLPLVGKKYTWFKAKMARRKVGWIEF